LSADERIRAPHRRRASTAGDGPRRSRIASTRGTVQRKFLFAFVLNAMELVLARDWMMTALHRMPVIAELSNLIGTTYGQSLPQHWPIR
jgi:hypothetical protein